MTALATGTSAVQPRPSPASLYAGLSPAERYIHRSRDAAWIALLGRNGVETLPGRDIVELGCGAGSFLRTLLHYGAGAERIEAVDVDAGRVARAREALPGVAIAVGDIACLPYGDASFDLAFAFTAFSSMLDVQARRRAAVESMRVLRPGGLLAVYDFWTNPTNRHVRALPEEELRHMFTRYAIEVERTTLAPPVVRVLRGNRALCRALERLPFLRTHLLAAVKKEAA